MKPSINALIATQLPGRASLRLQSTAFGQTPKAPFDVSNVPTPDTVQFGAASDQKKRLTGAILGAASVVLGVFAIFGSPTTWFRPYTPMPPLPEITEVLEPEAPNNPFIYPKAIPGLIEQHAKAIALNYPTEGVKGAKNLPNFLSAEVSRLQGLLPNSEVVHHLTVTPLTKDSGYHLEQFLVIAPVTSGGQWATSNTAVLDNTGKHRKKPVVLVVRSVVYRETPDDQWKLVQPAGLLGFDLKTGRPVPVTEDPDQVPLPLPTQPFPHNQEPLPPPAKRPGGLDA